MDRGDEWTLAVLAQLRISHLSYKNWKYIHIYMDITCFASKQGNVTVSAEHLNTNYKIISLSGQPREKDAIGHIILEMTSELFHLVSMEMSFYVIFLQKCNKGKGNIIGVLG